MKNSTLKSILIALLLIVILSAVSMPVFAGTDKTIILKKSTNKYIIYFENLCDNAFQFAVSNNSAAAEADLTFVSSAKDGTNENALNVAYVDETNNPTNEEVLYIWVKDSSNSLVITAKEIDLKTSIDENFINLINSITIANSETDRIKVDTTQTTTTEATIDGVDTSITTGKIVIDTHENSEYSFKLLPANDNTTDAGKLYELVDKINNKSGNAYERLLYAKEFYDLYMQLIPEDNEWEEVENGEILQPEDTINGDKFIVYIKELKDDDTEIIDVKLLECIRKEAEGKNERTTEITEEVDKVVSVPVTYDSIFLLVLLSILLIAITIIATLRNKKINKSSKH